MVSVNLLDVTKYGLGINLSGVLEEYLVLVYSSHNEGENSLRIEGKISTEPRKILLACFLFCFFSVLFSSPFITCVARELINFPTPIHIVRSFFNERR